MLEDPEVAALNGLLRDPSAIKKGMRPGLSMNLYWPLDIPAEELAFAYVSSPFVDLGKPLPVPSKEQRDVAFALVDRLDALRYLLGSGGVTAKGTLSQTGEVVLIDPLQWKRAGVLVHASNGDLCTEQNSMPVPICPAGLRLVAL